MDSKKTIFVAGHNGMVGSAIVRHLRKMGHENILTADRSELNLLEQADVRDFFSKHKIDCVYLAAAKVGGIHANNTFPAEFIYQNITLQTNLIHAAHCSDVQNLMFLGSSCIYPKLAQQPMKEDSLLTGELEQTNEPYAVAKIAGIKMCESYNRQYNRDYRSAMPTNLYGPNDNFHPENSHVVPALLRRFHHAVEAGDKEMVIWGSGKPMREFLHVDDMAAACVHIMSIPAEKYYSHVDPMNSHLNVGSGKDCTIRELAETIAKITNFNGTLSFDTTKPDGTPRKLMDTSKLSSLDWSPAIGLERGLKDAYDWYVAHLSEARTA